MLVADPMVGDQEGTDRYPARIPKDTTAYYIGILHIIQESYYYTRIQLLYKNPTIIQESNYYTRILLLYTNPTTIQESHYYTRIQLLYKNPTIIQESYYYTRILLL